MTNSFIVQQNNRHTNIIGNFATTGNVNMY
jgi:hypothetical protein